MDCSIAVNYLKERIRLTNGCGLPCEECRLSRIHSGFDMSCGELEQYCPERAVEILQKWSNEKPVKTRLEDFTEKYPNYLRETKDDTPNVCCKYLGYIDKCPLIKCSECWSKPV